MSKLNTWVPGRYLVEDTTGVLYYSKRGEGDYFYEVELLEVSPSKQRVKVKYIDGRIKWVPGSKYEVLEDLPDLEEETSG